VASRVCAAPERERRDSRPCVPAPLIPYSSWRRRGRSDVPPPSSPKNRRPNRVETRRHVAVGRRASQSLEGAPPVFCRFGRSRVGVLVLSPDLLESGGEHAPDLEGSQEAPQSEQGNRVERKRDWQRQR
jgi:hypothetical protein